MIEQILNPKMLNALGWSLIHSLWQVAAIAVLLALILLILRKSTARLRYNVAISSLLVCFCLFIATFSFYYFNENIVETQTVYIDNHTEMTEIFISNEVNEINYKNGNQSNFTLVFYDYFNTHLPIIVTLWFLGLTLFVIRFLGGLAYVQRLKHSNHQPLNEEWEMVLEEVKTKLKIDKVVQLVESSLVNVPMVIGYLKPMILMPIGAINYLTIEEVEAIFAHELAHIKRYDYFVNLLQSIIETILFYHPAIWWISSEIRRERENCCDDLALEVTGNSLTLAKALAKLEQFRMNFVNRKIQLSMTALKNKNQLLQRIQRILNEPQSNNSTLKGLFAAIILVVCFFATSLDAQEKPTSPTLPETPKTSKVETIIPASKVSFPEGKTGLKQSENIFPEAPKVTPNPVVPVQPTMPVVPTEAVAPIVPVQPMKPVQGLQPAQPVQPVGFTTFSFTPDEPEVVYIQLHNEKAVKRINTKTIDKIAVLKDTSIDGEIKEIVLIKEIKEPGDAVKEVKISIKKINGLDEITVYEDGRKLSKTEAEKYESEIRSDRMELNAITVEMKETEREMRVLEKEMQAEQRVALAEQRKAMAEERKRMNAAQLEMQQTMEETRAEMKRELEVMERKRAVEMERLKIEQEKMRLEMNKLEQEKSRLKDENGRTENLKRSIRGTARTIENLEKTIGHASKSASTTTTSTTTVSGTKMAKKQWFDEFIAVLKKDGLLDDDTDDIRLKLSENFMRLNGKRLSEAQAKKYYRLYEKLSGTKINGEVEIRKKTTSF